MFRKVQPGGQLSPADRLKHRNPFKDQGPARHFLGQVGSQLAHQRDKPGIHAAPLLLIDAGQYPPSWANHVPYRILSQRKPHYKGVDCNIFVNKPIIPG